MLCPSRGEGGLRAQDKMASGDDGAHAVPKASESGQKRAFVLPKGFKNLRPSKAHQKLLDVLRMVSTITIYSLTGAIIIVYCYLILKKGGETDFCHRIGMTSVPRPCLTRVATSTLFLQFPGDPAEAHTGRIRERKASAVPARQSQHCPRR